MVQMEMWDKAQFKSTRRHSINFERTYRRNSTITRSLTNDRKSVECQSNSSEIESSFLKFNETIPFFPVKLENSIDLDLSEDSASLDHTMNFGRNVGGNIPSLRFPMKDMPTRAEKRKRQEVIDASNQRIDSALKKAKLTNNHPNRDLISTNTNSKGRIHCNDFLEISLSDDECIKVEPNEYDAHQLFSHVEDQDSRIENTTRTPNKTEDNSLLIPIQMFDNNKDSNEIESREQEQSVRKLRRRTVNRVINEAKAPFQCTHCEYSCFQRKTLLKHLKIHPNGIFSCEKCPRKFITKDQLDEHLVVHKKIRKNVD